MATVQLLQVIRLTPLLPPVSLCDTVKDGGDIRVSCFIVCQKDRQQKCRSTWTSVGLGPTTLILILMLQWEVLNKKQLFSLFLILLLIIYLYYCVATNIVYKVQCYIDWIIMFSRLCYLSIVNIYCSGLDSIVQWIFQYSAVHLIAPQVCRMLQYYYTVIIYHGHILYYHVYYIVLQLVQYMRCHLVLAACSADFHTYAADTPLPSSGLNAEWPIRKTTKYTKKILVLIRCTLVYKIIGIIYNVKNQACLLFVCGASDCSHWVINQGRYKAPCVCYLCLGLLIAVTGSQCRYKTPCIMCYIVWIYRMIQFFF